MHSNKPHISLVPQGGRKISREGAKILTTQTQRTLKIQGRSISLQYPWDHLAAIYRAAFEFLPDKSATEIKCLLGLIRASDHRFHETAATVMCSDARTWLATRTFHY